MDTHNSEWIASQSIHFFMYEHNIFQIYAVGRLWVNWYVDALLFKVNTEEYRRRDLRTFFSYNDHPSIFLFDEAILIFKNEMVSLFSWILLIFYILSIRYFGEKISKCKWKGLFVNLGAKDAMIG